jgi:ferric-dicitrate binding protein FerR (iron transport regulator)
VEAVVRDALTPTTGAALARERIAEKIAAVPQTRTRSVQYRVDWMRTAIAAAVLLAAGLLIGFAAGRTDLARPVDTTSLVQVPMKVSEIDGTVLVKHQGADAWRVAQPGSSVHLGDTFHSMAKSGFVVRLAGKASTLEVNQNSMLVLTSYKKGETPEKDETQFDLEQGECTASLESPHGPFFISTPHGRVEALGTEFTVTVE